MPSQFMNFVCVSECVCVLACVRACVRACMLCTCMCVVHPSHEKSAGFSVNTAIISIYNNTVYFTSTRKMVLTTCNETNPFYTAQKFKHYFTHQ